MTPEDVLGMRDKVTGFLRGLGATDDQADEVVADLVACAVERGGMPSPTYVITAARYALYDLRRAAGRHVDLDALDGHADERPRFRASDRRTAAADGHEDAVVGRMGARDLLSRCALPAVQRRALELWYVDGLGWADMAAELGCTLWEAKAHFARAIGALRAALGVEVPPDAGLEDLHLATCPVPIDSTNAQAVLSRHPELHENQRKLMALRFVFGCSLRESAAIMGVTLDQSRSYNRNGIRRLMYLDAVTTDAA